MEPSYDPVTGPWPPPPPPPPPYFPPPPSAPPSAGHLAPQPQRLRPVRSATNLQGAHQPQELGFTDHHGGMPVDFVVDEAPQQHHQQQEMRRVKSSSALAAKARDPSVWKAALGEAQYFAGGLVSHPAETTRHFTVIRHCHALLWYRGPATTLPMTILADAPLPEGRTLWLQQKGYSGNMGMSLKALMGSGSADWIDVTPAAKAGVEAIPAAEERGIQRDLRRFAKAASGRTRDHTPRETHLVRIPAAATDGYFRVVVCDAKKKVLAGSAVFRIASTSTDAGVMRGASFSTLPLELGVKVVSNISGQVVRKYTGVAGAVVDAGRKRLTPGNLVVRKAAQTAYEGSGVEESWRRQREGRFEPLLRGDDQAVAVDMAEAVVGSDAGPEAPFPVRFDGRVVGGSGVSARTLGVPTANLAEVPDTVKTRLGGVFAAWARIVPQPGLDGVSHDWHEAVASIAPLRHAPAGVVPKNRVAVHFVHDFEGATFLGARCKVVLMAHLHAAPARDATDDDFLQMHAEDVMVAVTSLGRENWGPEEGRDAQKSFGERVNTLVSGVQNTVDRLPVHLVGVRSEAAALRDQGYGIGGVWVPR